jgi:predicted ATPase
MLALGAILIDPVPDSIIVIEEPELGLHPDLMPTVRGLVQSAAETAQIILTSHSTVLADAFTAYPESVVMIEKTDGNSTFRRLSTDDVDDLDDDGKGRGIGSLWMAGRLGGTRW